MRSLKSIIVKKLAKSLGHLIPEYRISNPSSLQEPPSLAPSMDATQIMSILSSAQAGYTRDLFSLYRDVMLADAHIQSEFAKRKLAVLGDSLTFLPFDKTNADDVAAALAVEQAIGSLKDWTRSCSHLLDSGLYPVSVSEKQYTPTRGGYSLRSFSPVPHHLLDFQSGRLQIYDVGPTGDILGTLHDANPDRYIIHRGNLVSAPDNWGGPMRSILFWWLLSTMSREWWARFLERYGAPFLVGKFSDDGGRTVLERAFSLSTRLGGLVVNEDTSVEIKQAAASDSGQAYKEFVTLCQREKSKLILGQSLSSEAQPTGLGSGTANLQSDVRQDIRKFDSASLAETLRDQLFTQFCRINRLRGRPPKLVWGSDSSQELTATFDMLKSMSGAGVELSDDGIAKLSERTGLDMRRSSVPRPLPFSSQSISSQAARIILSSRTKREAIERLSVEYPAMTASQIDAIVADAITASRQT